MSPGLKILDLLLSGLGVGFCFWLFYRILQRSTTRSGAISKVSFTVVLLAVEFYAIYRLKGNLHGGGVTTNAGPTFFMIASMAVVGVILSVIWTPLVADWLGSLLGGVFDGGDEPPERRPAYSIALSKRRQNKPLEAVVAIREQLAQFPNDFEGVMLLAKIQVEDLEDLPSAEMTLNHFCNAPDVPDQQVVKALTQLADWHLNIGSDEDSALRIMEQLMARFPDARISQQIAQRLGRFKTAEEKQQALLRVKPEISAQAASGKNIVNLKIRRRN